jgi:hypothetical protein
MNRQREYAGYEEALLRILTSEDPFRELGKAVGDDSLPPALLQALAAVDPDGLRLSALLVARLRFERLLRGFPVAERWFDEDPQDFTATFARYHAEVPLAAFFPAEEALLFQKWLSTIASTNT